MTAINILGNGERMHILTDGAAFDGAKVSRLISKPIIAPHVGVFVCAGPILMMNCLFAFLNYSEQASTFDDAVDSLSEGALKKEAKNQYGLVAYGWEANHIYLVGYSEERREVEAYFLPAGGDEKRGIKPWQLVQLGDDGQIGPIPTKAEMEQVGYRPMHNPDPLTDGIRLLEAQRLHRQEIPGCTGIHHSVGGFIQFTSVSKDGITTKIIHRWPDQIGEPIDPNRTARRHASFELSSVIADGLSYSRGA